MCDKDRVESTYKSHRSKDITQKKKTERNKKRKIKRENKKQNQKYGRWKKGEEIERAWPGG